MMTISQARELPSHCGACGAYLQGGATVHDADCPIGFLTRVVAHMNQALGSEREAFLVIPRRREIQ